LSFLKYKLSFFLLKASIFGFAQNIDYELVSKYPTLIKRPVLIQNGDVMVGFSEKKYLELLL